MNTNRRWLHYDTAKLIIAVMLLLLLLFVVPRSMLPSSSMTQAGALAQPDIPQELRAGLPQGYEVLNTYAGEWVIRDASGTRLYLWDAKAKQWIAVPTPVPPQPTAAAPTGMPALAPSATSAPAPAPTASQTPTAAPPAATSRVPEPTVSAPTATLEPTVAASPAAAGECGAAAPTRLEVGKSARVTSNLNLRSAPGISDNLIRVSLVGTTLKVIGGPQCLPYAGGVYRWWKVEAPDGVQGWSAEATLNGGMYFLEPVP